MIEICAGRGATAPVALESMEAGITSARWSLREGERIDGLLRAEVRKAAGDEEVAAPGPQDDRALLAWIASRDGAITANELRRGPRRYRKAGVDPEARLQELVDRGHGTWEVRRAPGAGRPTRVFRLLPGGGDEIGACGDEIGEFRGEKRNSVSIAASPGVLPSEREPGDEPAEDAGEVTWEA